MISVEPSRFARRVGIPVQRFISTEAASGAILMTAVIAALLWANSPWAASYHALWAAPVAVTVGSLAIDKPLLLWVNDGLMAIFFFVVGLEIKRELLHGELSSPRAAALPIAAAIGGMIAPAVIYVAINGFGETARGWAVPMATDIALALGVLALLGRRAPTELRVFLLALAIVDDLGAIAVIALFYTEALSLQALLVAAGLFGLIALGVRAGMRSTFVYLVLAVVFWVAILKSGVHATIAGVLLAMVVPASAKIAPDRLAEAIGAVLDRLEKPAGEPKEAIGTVGRLLPLAEAPLERLERLLHPWVSYLVVPIFALANAGVVISGEALTDAATSTITLGVAAGLLLGKPLGILGASAIMVRLGLAVLPHRVRWVQLAGAGVLAGIGFTVALFIDELAFVLPEQEDLGKVGILAASVVAGIAGYLLLRLTTASPPRRSAVEPIVPAKS
ncbi:MAG: Na+/H+ antiporter NhaA [Chloroflexota bacterium]|nr:Na+/H+ antiporter NhaA [Dehalococcoidia bacterium]MDW8252627.1 Na+/H+ antiporter NhaA [Chloroflexota bacterium]